MGAPLQTFSHYPAWPLPVQVPVVLDDEYPCVYLPGRRARMRWFLAERLGPEVYRAFMDSGFRRSGRIVYQPVCQGCRKCQPIRVVADRFVRSRSQRRCWSRNQDLLVSIDVPKATDEKFEVYRRYVRDWHGDGVNDESHEGFERFLYNSPVDSLEFTYRDRSGALLAAGICDRSAECLSSVYFYFDPAFAARGLGTFGALCELNYCRMENMPHYYLGYWILGCGAMEYKSVFRPCEVLCTDGMWREPETVRRDEMDRVR